MKGDELKKINDLILGFNDAENYQMRENKDLFNKVFVKTSDLDLVCSANTIFIIGDKGTGKTAIATYMVNNCYKDNICKLIYLRETDYHKFISLKKRENLQISDYSDIWKIILYLFMAQSICENEKKHPILGKTGKFKDLKKAIDEYYHNAFSPEVVTAMQFVDESTYTAGLVFNSLAVNGTSGNTVTYNENKFQSCLTYLKRVFEDAFSQIKLNTNYLLLIDGIDARPSTVSFEDYLECIQGLGNAVWSINKDIFSSIKDSKGRMRSILLVRPDIFNQLLLQNQNNKIRDNSVILEWETTYPKYRTSRIFELIDRLLASQQDETLEKGQAWDYYFPYKTEDSIGKQRQQDSFINFLRYSMYRPRDLITMMQILKKHSIAQDPDAKIFDHGLFDSAEFKKEYGLYLTGEIKDYMSFYYETGDFDAFINYFKFLKGKTRFSYEEFISAFDIYINYLSSNNFRIPVFCKTADTFLQFLYSLNIICYKEDLCDPNQEPFIHWCFRERNFIDLNPSVKPNAKYEIHYGLLKSLNVGLKKY